MTDMEKNRTLLCVVWGTVLLLTGSFAPCAEEVVPIEKKESSATNDASAQNDSPEKAEKALPEKDTTTPENWRKEAEAGDDVAMVNLAYCLAKGDAKTKRAPDPAEAEKWLEKAAALGNSVAMLNLGAAAHARRDYETARKWFVRAEEEGELLASFPLGALCEAGLGGAKDMEEAVRHYRTGAERGEMRCRNRLGVAYMKGQGGLERDPQKALTLFLRAAFQEYAPAMNNAGIMITHGIGSGRAPNPEEGAMWYRRAGDYPPALIRLADYHLSKDTPEDQLAAFTIVQKASKMDVAEGHYLMGMFYLYGRAGCKVNPEAAFLYYSKAAEKGYVYAQIQAGRMLEEGIGTKKDAEAGKRLQDAGFSKLDPSVRPNFKPPMRAPEASEPIFEDDSASEETRP